MDNTQRATKRTTYNATLAGSILLLVNYVLDTDLTLNDIAPFIPVLALAYGLFYRLSIAVSKRWPTVGWVLFADNSEPPHYFTN